MSVLEYIKKIGLLICLLMSMGQLKAQHKEAVASIQSLQSTAFSGNGFVENIGQYGRELKDWAQLGPITHAFDGLDMPVLFSNKGIIHLHRKIKSISHEEEERLEKAGVPEEEIERRKTVIDRTVALEWLQSNPDVQLEPGEEQAGYRTFGYINGKARSFSSVRYRNIYPGIDFIFRIRADQKPGYEWLIEAKAGSDLSAIQWRIGGDVKKCKTDREGNLVIATGVNETIYSAPVAYYGVSAQMQSAKTIPITFELRDAIGHFRFPADYNRQQDIVIDPFVSNTLNLTGANAGIAKDVDFDYAGNIYVTGGGDGSVHKLAKFDANGILQWTFSGSLTVPAWAFGTYYGGWVVEKNSGRVYLGQGFAPGAGWQVIRLNTEGIYDNYITPGNTSFQENWKMIWSCNNGTPQIIAAGGGTNSNNNLGIFAPPGTAVSASNLTGITNVGTNGWAQDVADIVLDQSNGDIYTIYGSLIGTPSITNRIYKNAAPYNASTLAWNVASGFTTVQEIANRPYLVAGQIDNSANMMAVNSSYLFYWDGRNLKAFNKATGANAGTAVTIAANTALQQGGIVADECNNVFIGSSNGTIKVYKFNGSTFDDAAAADLTITGFTTAPVFDLSYNEAMKLMYVSGRGFVASVDVSAYNCGSSTYTLSVTADCATLMATATISPAPPSGSTVTYQLYNGTLQVASNSTGIFSGLVPNVSYSMHAIINQSCSGVQTISNFSVPAPNLSVAQTNALCGNNNGSITITASNGVAPLQYSINNGVSFQAGSVFPNLPAGVYPVLVKDANGCQNTATVTIINSNGPTVSLTAFDASCNISNGLITATGSGGTAPYQYALNNGTYQTGTNFPGLAAGTYIVSVQDGTGCVNSGSISVGNIGTTVIRFVVTPATCGNTNGNVSVIVTGGLAPYQYSLDGLVYQVSSSFTGLSAATYTIWVKDASGCTNTASVTVNNVAGPQLTATGAPASCLGATGTITAFGSGGTAPLLYSINGGAFQLSNTFFSLPIGTYTVSVIDANGCGNSTTVTISNSLPQVTGLATAATCNVSNGSISVVGTGGSTPYQYAVNGGTYQLGNLFTGLAAGSYTINIRDASGCMNSFSPIIVPNAAGLTVTATSTLSGCVSGSGTITATGSGGAAPLQYRLNAGALQASGIFTGLAAGNYTVNVVDANGCTSSVVISVGQIGGPSVTATSTSASCSNATGTITATGTGGAAPYTYSIDGTTYQTATLFTGLSPALYTVIVKDANSCAGTVNILVTNNGAGSGPTVTADATPAECGLSNGRIDANGNGGQNPLRYSLDGINYQSSSTFNNIPPGTYTVFVRDRNNCVNVTSIVVPNIAGPQVSATTTPSTCGSSTGTITANGFDGAAPYRYSIDGGANFQTSAFFSGLASGFYTVTVRDADNVCRNSIVVYIGNSNGADVTATVLPARCGSNNGEIQVHVSGGVDPITYSINGVDFQSSSVFTGLSSGTYPITVMDGTGCGNAISVTVNLATQPIVSATTLPEACNNHNGRIQVLGSNGAGPYQYSIDGVTFQSASLFTGLTAGSYTVTLKDANDCESTTNVTIASVNGPQLSAATTASSCSSSNGTVLITASSGVSPYQYSINGTTYQSSFVFANVAAGPYTAYVRDVNGCVASVAVSVASSGGPNIAVTSTAATCASGTGTITVTGSGGTGALTYSIDGSSYVASGLFASVLPGNYFGYVKDAIGCINSLPVTVQAPDYPSMTLTLADAGCSVANGSITVTGSGGSGVYSYSLDGLSYQASGLFGSLGAGSYTVFVKDGLGCVKDSTVTLTVGGSLSGLYTVGAGGDFASLTAAVQAYNTQCIGGPIVFELTDAAYAAGETFPIEIQHNSYASPVNTLTIKPALGVHPLITGDDPVALIVFNGCSYVTIDGADLPGGTNRNLDFRNSNANSSGNTVIWLHAAASGSMRNNSIQQCNVEGNTPATTVAAIAISASVLGESATLSNNQILIRNNACSKAQYGILAIGGQSTDTALIIENNDIGQVNAINGIGLTGIKVSNQQSALLQYNHIIGVTSTGASSIAGLDVGGTQQELQIRGNEVRLVHQTNAGGMGAAGIRLNSSTLNSQTQVYNNVITDVTGYGSTIDRTAAHNGFGLVISNGSGYTILHNTVVLNSNQSASGYSAALLIEASVPSGGVVLMNNILGNQQTQAGAHHALVVLAGGNALQQIDYNDYFIGSGSLAYLGADLVSLADLRSGTGQDIHSINVTPAFVSPTDFHIDPANVSNGVNLGDRGTNMNIADDIDFTTRSVLSPDMGADEWLKPNYASWVGRVSIDWLVPENWETNVVPDSTTDVYIKGGFTHMPTIVTTQAVRDLNLSAPGTPPVLTLDQGTIQILGQINHSGGTIDGAAGTVEMRGTVAQPIPAGLFNNNALLNLLINNSSVDAVRLEGPLDIYRSVAFGEQGLQLNTNDFLTLKSTSTETAWVGNLTGKTIAGLATVERYIPNHAKAWQLLAIPTSGQTIKESWQEGSASPNANPLPGFGTQITSNVPNPTVHPSPGFDLASPNGPSMKIYNPLTGLYDGVASTQDPIYQPKGYMLFVRGDRSATTFNAPPSATVLRTKGTMFSPQHPPPVHNILTGTAPRTLDCIGNPYAAAIDLTKLTLNESGGGVQDVFYVWDPLLTSAGNSTYGLGGFQTLTRNGSAYDVTPGGGSYGPVAQFIQSGQAFFVNAPFQSGSVKFTEDAKATGSLLVNRSGHRNNLAEMRVNLNVLRNGTPVLLDGIRVQFDPVFSPAIDMQDAQKLAYSAEQISIRSHEKALVVEQRNMPQAADTIFLEMKQMRAQTYRFDIALNNLQEPGLAAFLEDRYLNVVQPLSMLDSNFYLFQVDTAAGANAPNRFHILFQRLAANPVLFVRINAQRSNDQRIEVNWGVEQESNLQSYTIERSHNGQQFEDLGNQQPSNNQGQSAAYRFIDHQPLAGWNFYRIRALGLDGRIFYSTVVRVSPAFTQSNISIYPTPVTQGLMHIRLEGQKPGKYRMLLFAGNGQMIYQHSFEVLEASQVTSISLPHSLSSGSYQVKLISPDNQLHQQNIIIQK
jgi:hypothetical protein